MLNISHAVYCIVLPALLLGLTGCPQVSNEGGGQAFEDLSDCSSQGGLNEKTENCEKLKQKVSIFSSNYFIAGTSSNLVVDSNGNIYYPNINGRVIQKIDRYGNQSVFAGSGVNDYVDGVGAGASFYVPFLVAIDKSDNLYVADGFKIRKITQAGIVSTIAEMATSGTPHGIAVDSQSNIYFVWDDGMALSHVIQKITPLGVISIFAGSHAGYLDGIGTSAQFNNPKDLVVDSLDNVFVVDTGNFLIRKITPTGGVTTFAGNGNSDQVNGVGTDASFSFEKGYAHMSIDSSNNIYVEDIKGFNSYATDSSAIRKVTDTGVVTTYCGVLHWKALVGKCSEVGVDARFGVAVAPNGEVYFGNGSGIFKISK